MNKNILYFFINAFFLLISFLSSIFTLITGLGNKKALFVILAVVFFIIFCIFAYLLIKLIIKNCRWEQVDEKFVSICTIDYADLDDLKEIVAIDEKVFSHDDLIDISVFKQWYYKNNTTFKVMRHRNKNKFIGYYSLLPLKAEILNLFIRGDIKESNFKSEDILSIKDMSKCEGIYLFSLVIHKKFRYYLKDLLKDLRKTIIIYKKRYNIKTVFATAATKAGENLLERFKFINNETYKTDKRQDNHVLYYKELNDISDVEKYFILEKK